MIATISSFQEAPTLAAVCQRLEDEDASTSLRSVQASSLRLDADGTLAVKGEGGEERLPIPPNAMPHVADLAAIPASYFADCDPPLRAVSFNSRIQKKVAPEATVWLTLRNGNLDCVQKSTPLWTPRLLPILDTIADTIPAGITSEDIRVADYSWGEAFDVSVIAPGLVCRPRAGDTVAFGVNVSRGLDGAVQVQGATWRLGCANGAVFRVCNGRKHRIRRPIAKGDREEQLLDRVRSFAALAWGQWQEHAEALQQLTDVPLGESDFEALAPRLRQAPFFLSAGVVELLLDRLASEIASHGGVGDLWDLYNAFTFLGTHEASLRRVYRLRLRFGAGELGRRDSRICHACRQLLLPRRPIHFYSRTRAER